MNLKKYGILLALVSFLSYCENHDHSDEATAYECKVESFTFDNADQATSCATMPTEITAKVEDLVVPAGKSYTLYLYGTDGTSGYTITFNQTSISVTLPAGVSNNSNRAGFIDCINICITVHDITVEKHILVYSGEACSGLH